MRRRHFLGALGSTIVTCLPSDVVAQSAVIAVLHGGIPAQFAPHLAALRRGLNEQGYAEDRNLKVIQLAAEGKQERLPELAAEIVRQNVAVMVTMGGGAVVARAAKAATTTIPIVFLIAGDPVSIGLVASMNRPGGNMTGVSLMASESAGKRLELLRELVPQVKTVAWLVNPNSGPAVAEAKDGERLANSIGLQTLLLNAQTDSEIDQAFGVLRERHASGLIVSPDGFVIAKRHRIVELAARYGVPVIYPSRDFPEAGGLIGYGTSLYEGYRHVGAYVGRILKGTKPADLPIFQLTKFELVVNLKSAKQIGLQIPESFLLRADEVIE